MIRAATCATSPQLLKNGCALSGHPSKPQPRNLLPRECVSQVAPLARGSACSRSTRNFAPPRLRFRCGLASHHIGMRSPPNPARNSHCGACRDARPHSGQNTTSPATSGTIERIGATRSPAGGHVRGVSRSRWTAKYFGRKGFRARPITSSATLEKEVRLRGIPRARGMPHPRTREATAANRGCADQCGAECGRGKVKTVANTVASGTTQI
jgi:hypothetical protein